MLNFLEEVLINNWMLVGADSNTANTGKANSIIVRCEHYIGHRLHWDILCLLHTNKLPLHHLLQKLEGPTSGNVSFKGPVGKMPPHVDDLEWNENFIPITTGPELHPLPQVLSDLSTDKKYLLLAMTPIHHGVIHIHLRHLKPCSLSHTRWLTLASRLCRLYMSKHQVVGNPLDILNTLVFFVVTNYAPMWFGIKEKPDIQHAPFHVLRKV